MITNVSLVTVYCLDQDEARDFYVDVLGFEPGTDVTMGDGFRWVTVCHPDHPELEVTLMMPGPPLDPEAAELHPPPARQGPDGRARPEHGRLPQDLRGALRKGVEFLQEPADRPYGVEAVMRDISGNWLVLVEPREFTPDA